MKSRKCINSMLLSLCISMLCGCAVLAPTQPYSTAVNHSRFDTSSSLSHTRSTAPTANFNGLTLSRAISTALDNNPEVVATDYDVLASRARKNAAWGAMLPSLSAQGAYTLHSDNQRLAPARYNGESGTFSDTIYSGDLVLKMPLFAGGTLINEARAKNLLSQAAEHRLSRTREELVFNVTSVYSGILAQQQLIESLQFSHDAISAHLKRVNDLITAQKAAKVDRLRTEVRLADIQQSIVAARNSFAIQKQLLSNLMGVEAKSESLTLAGDLGKPDPLSMSLSEGLTFAFDHRPDYLAARKELEAQAKQVDVARGELSPTIDLFGAYGGRWASDPARELNAEGQMISDSDFENEGRVGIELELPLFRGGQMLARVREEQAKLAAAQERLHKLELQIRLEVETALLNLDSGLKRVLTLRKSMQQAEESLRIERQKYELGKGAIVDVLDSQAALLGVETYYYNALAEVHVARAQIELATGTLEEETLP